MGWLRGRTLSRFSSSFVPQKRDNVRSISQPIAFPTRRGKNNAERAIVMPVREVNILLLDSDLGLSIIEGYRIALPIGIRDRSIVNSNAWNKAAPSGGRRLECNCFPIG